MSKGKAQRTCVFCGGGPISSEHVIPKWISKLPLIRRELDWGAQFHGNPLYLIKHKLDESGFTTGADFVERGRQYPMNAIEVPVVCKEECNEGWMSRLEVAVREPLTALINNEEYMLTRAEIVSLSAWAVKTAMMFEFNDPSTIAFSNEQRQSFYANKAIPDGVEVLVCHFDDENRLRLHHGGAKLAKKGTLVQFGTLGATTIVLGHVAFLVCSASDPDYLPMIWERSLRSDRWVELWPAVTWVPWDSLYWQPSPGITHQDVMTSSGLF